MLKLIVNDESKLDRDELLVNKRNELKKENDYLKQRLAELKHSTTYQLSYHINKVGTLRGFLRFPIAFYKVLKQYKQKAVEKQAKEAVDNALFNEFKGDNHAEEVRVEKVREKFRLRCSQPQRLKVASILDEFSFNCFEPECDLIQLSACAISEQLSTVKPDLIFIESAWQGKNGEWFKKVRHVSPELTEVLRWARINSVPTMLWNKEDPVHFSAFLPIARLVDFVFTTDSCCVPEYQKFLKHQRVSLLPFAAQPNIHNPVEQYERIDKFCFAGSYYKNYPQRQVDFETLMSAVSKFKGVDIFDRNFNVPDSQNVFPQKYKEFILGNLPFNEIAKAYKGYSFGINMNTIKDSPSMFARRVYELMASNTIVVSNYAEGINNVFGKLVINSDDEQQLQDELSAVCGDFLAYKKMRLKALREVMSKHTYEQRFSLINSFIANESIGRSLPSVLVVGYINNSKKVQSIIKQFSDFEYSNKALLIVGNERFDSVDFKYDGTEENGRQLISKISKYDYIAFVSDLDIYTKNYLTDLVLAYKYADISVAGKVTKYISQKNELKLMGDGSQYRYATSLEARCSMVESKKITFKWLKSNITDIDNAIFTEEKMLAIDEFNYCKNGLTLSSNSAGVSDELELVNA